MKGIKGQIVHAERFGELTIVEDGILLYSEQGIEGVFKTLPQQYEGCEIEDYGNALVFPAFSDLHFHAPQYPMVGMGMDLPLLSWLSTYTFPMEAHFADTELARKVYRQLADELIRNGTTRVAAFSSLHTDATLVLMEEFEKRGLSGYVGKVNMDICDDPALQETTASSISETKRWLQEARRFKAIHPILTPRFTPSCSEELLSFLGKTAQEGDYPIQSHLSENEKEIALVKATHPDCEEYYQTYEKHGLWNNRTLMAHCVHCSPAEKEALRKDGVTVVHCPSSNENLASGNSPVRELLNLGIHVVLGSDIAGGDHISMFDNVTAAIRASKQVHIASKGQTPFLAVAEAFYLATSSAQTFFGEQPGFAKGNSLHALVIQDDKLPEVKALTVEERFLRAMYRRQESGIQAVYANNQRIL